MSNVGLVQAEYWSALKASLRAPVKLYYPTYRVQHTTTILSRRVHSQCPLIQCVPITAMMESFSVTDLVSSLIVFELLIISCHFSR